MLILWFALRGFYPGTLVFSSLQKPTFPNFDSIIGIATSKTLFIYLFIKDLFYCIIQSMPRRKPLPVIRKVNISPCYVMFENDASCSIVVDPQEQVTFADVVKERGLVAVGHNGFFDLFIWGQSHHIIAYVVTGHVDVPHVLILLLG